MDYVTEKRAAPNILYVDIDGTLGEFRNVEVSKLYEKGYFLSVKPNKELIEVLENLKGKEFEIYILSSYLADSPYALDEKRQWCEKYLGFINEDHRIFTPCGISKADYICDARHGSLGANDILLDDYSMQLHAWRKYGGRGIKFLNGINGTKGTWTGETISKLRIKELNEIVAA